MSKSIDAVSRETGGIGGAPLSQTSPLPQAPEEEAALLSGSLEMHPPVLITSLGQSADSLMLLAVLNRLDISAVSDPVAEADTLSGYGCVFVAVGASSKGLSIAGLTPEYELARAEELAAALIESEVPVLTVNIGGNLRTDKLTSQLMQAMLPVTDALLIIAGGDDAGSMRDYAEENGVLYIEAESVLDSAHPIGQLFSQQ